MSEVHDGATLRAALLEIASDFSFTWIAETRLLFDALEPRRFASSSMHSSRGASPNCTTTRPRCFPS